MTEGYKEVSVEDICKIIHFLQTYEIYLKKQDTSSSRYAIDSIDDVIQRIEK